MGIRFWHTKFRYGISRCALRLGYEMLFGIRNDVRSYGLGREVVVFLLACALSGSAMLMRFGTKFLNLVL